MPFAMLKTCALCGSDWPIEAFFRLTGVANAYATRRRPVCIGCEQSARDEKKSENRWRAKMVDARRRHARGFGLSVPVLANSYGWDLDRMTRDAERAYSSDCPYCEKPFSTMPHGPHDLTIDIVDPTQPPHYVVNVRLVCKTCNREKSRTPPSIWATKIQCWKEYRVRRALGPRQRKLF
jgi:hypothetical protein